MGKTLGKSGILSVRKSGNPGTAERLVLLLACLRIKDCGREDHFI